MSNTEILRYKVKIEMTKAPRPGVAQNGFRVAHKLKDGCLYSGSYIFSSGILKEHESQDAELSLLVPRGVYPEVGNRIELYDPINMVGYTTINGPSD